MQNVPFDQLEIDARVICWLRFLSRDETDQ